LRRHLAETVTLAKRLRFLLSVSEKIRAVPEHKKEQRPLAEPASV
jgi:hypothetical protein